MNEAFKTPKLAALVYRLGKGCRQYAFESADDLQKWAARHPYRSEMLTVHCVGADLSFGEKKTMPANEAADFVRKQGGAA